MPLNTYYLEIHDQLLKNIESLEKLLKEAIVHEQSAEDKYVHAMVYETMMRVNETLKILQIYQKDIVEGEICKRSDNTFEFISGSMHRKLSEGHYVECYDEQDQTWHFGKVAFEAPEKIGIGTFCVVGEEKALPLTNGMHARIRVC